MKQITLISINDGSNVGTYSPFCFIESFKDDINKTCLRCLSYDNDMQIETNLYSSDIIEIPVFMSEEFYLRYDIKYHWLKAMMNDFLIQFELTENMFFKLIKLSEEYQYFINWLFKGNTKNLYKLSIREQILNWLNNENNNYDKPLSVNQFLTASKYCPIYKANKISNKLYNSKYWKN